MSESRRNFLKKSLAASAWCLTIAGNLLASVIARAAWSADSFSRTDVKTALSTLLGKQTPTDSDKIKIKIPEVAENGAMVPITVHSELEQTESITIFAEKNPVPLIAQFNFTESMVKQITARIKLADTGNVIVIVRADGQFYRAQKTVQVTVGGCGD